MADDHQTAEADETLDASYKPDAATLGGDEADFAKALGFGLDGNDGASSHTSDDAEVSAVEHASHGTEVPAVDHASQDPEVPAVDDPSPENRPTDRDMPLRNEADGAEPGADEEDDARGASAAPHDAPSVSDDSPSADPVDEQPVDAASVDYEDIYARPASQGLQETIQARADDVLARSEIGAPVAAAPPAVAAPYAADGETSVLLREELAERDRALAAALAELDATHADLAAARSELDQVSGADEKELEEVRIELDTVLLERDQLIDQLAATSGQLVQSQQTAERLEASLRAARGALVPLPAGERALRAEVIGLRGRLDEAGQENVRLASEVAAVATELAIATARVEDRQHEIDHHADRVADLEKELAENDRRTEEAIGRHREALGLATRLQAENNELRSAQAALEETLQARDLEITAREEHLRVTREGLATRDRQLVDLRETLEQERHRIEALEADLERAALEKGVLLDKIARRESRIATLTNTLGQIEEAMGQRLHLHPPPRPALAEAERTEPATTGARTSVPSGVSSATRPEPAPEARLLDRETDDDPTVSREPAPTPPAAPTREPAETILDAIDAAPFDAPRESPAEEPAPTARILSAPPALPPILRRWRDQRLVELEEAEADSVADFLAGRLVAHLGAPTPEAIHLRSLGGALPDAEARLVAALHERGVEGIRMEVLDGDEEAAEARRACIELACLGEVIDVRVGDLPDWDAEAPCHAILLADALHAQANPAAVLDHLAPTLARGALLLFVGQIGAGPVQLSASTLMRLEELWQFLPEPLASAADLARPPFRGDDGGTPAVDGDPAAALVDRFEATALVGFGHLADLVVGPSRGFAISEEDEDARQLLQSIVAIDESRGITEALPPRHGVGVFAHGSVGRTECFGLPWPCLADALR